MDILSIYLSIYAFNLYIYIFEWFDVKKVSFIYCMNCQLIKVMRELSYDDLMNVNH